MSSQFNGLLIKNFNLLTKQTGTMICQVLTPIFCLGFVYLIQVLIQENIGKSSYGIKNDFPMFFNLPIYDKLAFTKLPIETTTCEEWYLYDFDKDTPEEDKEFFGFNESRNPAYVESRHIKIQDEEQFHGTFRLLNQQINNFDSNNSISSLKDQTKNDFFNFKDKKYFAESSGLLTSGINVIQKYCDKGIPYLSPRFVMAKADEVKNNYTAERKEFDNNINYELYNQQDALNKMDFNDIKKGIGLNVLADGAVLVKRANKNEFSYNIQINDNRFPFYHKANGVTMFRIKNKETGKFTPFLNVLNGALWITDLMNKAYLKYFHPELYVVSGLETMPFELDNAENIQRIINILGSTFYPLAISLFMPLFMYTIVLEKESRLVEIMKINGLKMTYYWLSLFVYDFIIYSITFTIFFLVGRFAFAFKMFIDTNFGLMFFVFFGWGLSQIGLAVFFQAFLSNARTSTSNILF